MRDLSCRGRGRCSERHSSAPKLKESVHRHAAGLVELRVVRRGRRPIGVEMERTALIREVGEVP